MQPLLSLLCLALQVSASTIHHRHFHGAAIRRLARGYQPPPFTPQAKSVEILANVTNPSLTRDSCGSVPMGGRTFWTCRDTSLLVPNSNPPQYAFVFVNSAGWTDSDWFGCPSIQDGGPIGAGSDGNNSILLMSGPQPTIPAFYPLAEDQCPGDGVCEDGTSRWTGWPDSPPMVSEVEDDGYTTAYTWVKNIHLNSSNLGVLNPQGSATLYKMTYTPTEDTNVLPNVTTVDMSFWQDQQILYGTYGNFVHGKHAYLYGQMEDPTHIALARVPTDCIENKDSYEYYVDGAWTSQMPTLNATGVQIPNASAGGQGTYYYSARHNSFVWIGQPYFDVSADFYITTAPRPEGPWIEPYLLWKGPNGDGALPSYSLQAHPHLQRSLISEDGIYVTWTQFFKPETNPAGYVTPLAFISFE